MRRRRLNPDDLEVWRAVARTARPLVAARAVDTVRPPAPAAAPPAPAIPEAPTSRGTPPFAIGDRAPAPRPVSPPERRAPPVDRRALVALTRGRLVPEARVDLHGLTAPEAHGVLNRFVLDGAAHGRRLLLVITGKGRDGRDGLLRREVPHWLALQPLGPHVLHTAAAHRRHGGDGALYVFLRRRR
jgi:DNA-nicking Smr family endonuclease